MASEAVLQNDCLRVAVLLPDPVRGAYRGPRFDWSGMIARVEHGGHVFFGPWNPEPDPSSHDGAAVGTASEFGMFTPLGFDEAAPGEPFVKVGVGVLERPDEAPYAFHRAYRFVQHGAWQIERGADWIAFMQRIDGPYGFAYRLTTEVALTGNGPALTLARRLENAGERPIETEFYNHHFTRIDDIPVGPRIALTLPFDAVATADAALLSGRRLTFPAVLAPGQSFWTALDGLTGAASDHAATIVDQETGASVAFAGDRAPFRYAVWGMVNCLCPEPFVAVRALPGETFAWREDLAFAAGEAGK